MTTRPESRPCPQFAGLESRRATSEQVARANANMRRTHRNKRLAAKLDDLLGPVDEEDDHGR